MGAELRFRVWGAGLECRAQGVQGSGRDPQPESLNPTSRLGDRDFASWTDYVSAEPRIAGQEIGQLTRRPHGELRVWGGLG